MGGGGMSPGAAVGFCKLWVAKKVAVLGALGVDGLKKLYRGGWRLNNRLVTDPWAHGKVRGVMHSVAAGAMKMGDKFERPARCPSPPRPRCSSSCGSRRSSPCSWPRACTDSRNSTGAACG